jgi:hypothetical protein
VFRQAARAWNDRKPHRALEIIREAGYGADEWREFQRIMLRRARARFDRAMASYRE